jgi:cation diffusion facilitator CzcD-associated flavoprotein CzcO
MTAMRDVAVIGAGPYGLAATAHLRAGGLDVHAFGRPMDLWERMPVGMLLRSSWEASTISDPTGELSLDAYEAEHGLRLSRPIPLADYLRYGRWYQGRAVPDVDRRRVVALRGAGGGFELELDDGAALAARRVIVATGPNDHARRPPELAGLPAPLVRHSSTLCELGAFAGTRTAIVGSGQSAIELAALLHEAGASVEVIARADRIRWLRRSGWLHQRDGVFRRLLYPPTDVGPVGLSQLVAVPDAWRRLPVHLGERIAYRCIRPAAASWLVDRTAPVRLTLGRRIAAATPAGDALRLTLDDGSAREVDRLVLATGYDVRADRHPLIGPELRAQLRTRRGAPLLAPGFESSVPGLHFVGAFAAASFGPVMRFVSGTPYTGRALARHIVAPRRAVAVPSEAAASAAA